jgi:TRAP-type transport system periplasmic protein
MDRHGGRLDFAGSIARYRGAPAGRGRPGNAWRVTIESHTRGGRMRALLRGLTAVAMIAAVVVAVHVAPAGSQAKPGAKKLDLAYLLSPPESGAVGLKFMAEEVTKRSNGSLNMVFHGGTLLNKELEIMDAVKSGNVAVGSPIGAASTVFPEMGVFLTPYLVRDYQHAYAMFNGQIGRDLDETFQKKYRVKVLFFFDYGFRHFWNNKRPINNPADLKGLKMRVQQGRVFADTVNGLGASAVPMPWGEVIPAAQQGVIDGADLPVVNINALKVYEVSKYASMTYHNYGPTVLVMNLDIWKGLTPEQQKLVQEVGAEAQKKIREATESVDNFAKAKEILEAKGMKVNAADIASFRKLAEEKIWPQYRQQYAEWWDKVASAK